MLIQPLAEYENFYVVKHPFVQYKMTLLRDSSTNQKLFRELTEELALLVGYEAMNDLDMIKRSVKTPLESFDSPDLANHEFVITPILRAGLGMVYGILSLIPMAQVGFIGLYRDENTFEPQSYYIKLPKNCQDAQVVLCDPMLATGGSAIAAVKKLKEAGVKKMHFICLVAAPEGVKKFCSAHPDVTVVAASLDRQLNDNAYILPGLGDAGDRLWAVR